MCMTVGSAVLGKGSFVACDTRMVHFDGGASDTGGKLFSTGSGWATGAGAGPPFEDSMAALKAAGPIPDHFKHNVAARAGQIVFGAMPEGPEAWPRNHMLVIEPQTGVILLVYRTAEVCEMTFAADGPSDMGNEWAEFGRVMRESITDAGDDLAARIRVAAGYFESAAIRSYDMSNVMEIGYFSPDLRRGFLRGKARDIANARVEDIFERFEATPLDVSPLEAASRTSRGARICLGLPAEYNSTGNIIRGRPLDDGIYSLRASASDGSTAVSDAFNGQGSLLPTPIDNGPFSYNSGGATSGQMWLSWNWSTFLVYRPDGSTISVPGSASLATPPSPTLSQVVSGALAGRTRFVRIGYTKNSMVMRVGAEASLAISANNLLKVTSPGSVTGYDGWIPLVGATTNTEFTQSSGTSVAFGTDWTEPVGGADISGQTPYDNTRWPNAVTAWGLNASATFYYYPWYEIASSLVAFADRGQTVKIASAAVKQNMDGRVALSVGAFPGATPAGGASGSGGTLGGNKLL